MIPKDFFTNNRRLLSEALDTKPAIFSSHTQMQSRGDAAYAFIQESNFWWLTGIDEPDWKVVIGSDRTCLVAPKVSDARALFDGGLQTDEARQISGIDDIINNEEFDALLSSLSKKYGTVYALGEDPHAQWYEFTPNPAREQLAHHLEIFNLTVEDCRPALAKLRALKQPLEIETVKQAVLATTGLFTALRAQLPSLDYEYEVEALFTYSFRRGGLDGHAYDPIVASGKNACTLHYGKNNDRLPENGLVLIDVGAKVNGYAADITRTFAVGIPSEREVAVHKAVEAAHFKIIDLIKPGLKTKDYQAAVDEIMKDALQEVNLLTDRNDEKTYRKYFPHAISHGLGLDVHESLGGFGEFKPGMILTVEPGIYIPEEGIGVRIEDDVLVTETGHENLSASLTTSL